MTRKKQEQIIKRQLRRMLKDFEERVMKKAESAVKSSAVPPEYKDAMIHDDHLLAKAVLDSAMRDRPYAPLSDYKKDFDNIHYCI